MPKMNPPNAQPNRPIVVIRPPTLPISAKLGLPPRSSVMAWRNTSPYNVKSVMSSDQQHQPLIAGDFPHPIALRRPGADVRHLKFPPLPRRRSAVFEWVIKADRI